MRPSARFAILLLLLLAVDGGLLLHGQRRRASEQAAMPRLVAAVSALGLTDLAVSTEARYTRHPAVSDPIAPFMDHPGAVEHFPSGSFFAPASRALP
ncbi:MAG: hypothetical protein ACOY3Z_08165 [Thermodesulfobacteriota bacterium]